MPTAQVKVANGDILTTETMIPKMEWWAQGHTFHTDMRVLELGAYDAILGFDWLKQHSPMQCHWANKQLEFEDEGVPVLLQGLNKPTTEPSEISAEQLCKWLKGNDVWALAMLEYQTDDSQQNVSAAIEPILAEYNDVFRDPKTLPPSRTYDHTIPLVPGVVPVNTRPYRYSPSHKDEIERQVKELLASGLIVPSTSPFASPVLLVQKKDGSWRFCVDYRKLNTLTIKNRFPLPIIDEILDELAMSKYFAVLDMRAGYHQVRMAVQDEYKTTFKTHHGHYQFRVMPFGLTNAPATFQCLVNELLEPFLRKFVLVFLDDILIYSASLEEHVNHLRQVLQKLREHNLFVK